MCQCSVMKVCSWVHLYFCDGIVKGMTSCRKFRWKRRSSWVGKLFSLSLSIPVCCFQTIIFQWCFVIHANNMVLSIRLSDFIVSKFWFSAVSISIKFLKAARTSLSKIRDMLEGGFLCVVQITIIMANLNFFDCCFGKSVELCVNLSKKMY